jgi:glycosyltransferase involved in cell wall biosynthesis
MTDTFEPITSVVLIAGDQRARAALALKSLLTQAGIEQAEIIVFDCGSRLDMPPLAGSDHPQVRVIRRLERKPYGVTCAEGARLARGKYVAFLEEHCQARPGYLTAIEKALSDWVAAGVAVQPFYSDLRFSNVVFLMNYPVQLRVNVRRKQTSLLVGHNMVYRRETLMRYSEHLEELLENDVVFNSILLQRGEPIGIEPDLQIQHANEKSLLTISRGYYLWHWAFAYHRWRQTGWSPAYKLLRLLTTPLMPGVRWLKYLGDALFKSPADLPLVLLYAPHIWVAQSAAALGTLLGYFLDPGQVMLEFADYEIDTQRDVPELD